MNQRIGIQVRMLIVVLAISGLTALAGCYTVLKHPPTAEVADSGEGQRDCYSCHGPGGAALAYDPLHAPGFDYYPDTWYGYYAYPWWWRDYWQDDIYDHGSNVGSGGRPGLWDGDNDSSRRLWGRGSAFLPPALPPINAGPTFELPRRDPASTQPPPINPDAQQPGRTIKEGVSPPPAPAPPPAAAPPPKPVETNEDKDDGSKSRREAKESDRKQDGGGGS